MNIALWIVQGALAAFFLAGGIAKWVLGRKGLADRGMPWVEDFSDTSVKAIGTLEALAAIGLILPAITGVAPVLVPLAAAGLGLLMVGAAIVHVRRDELSEIGKNAALLVLAAFIVWGRLGPYGF